MLNSFNNILPFLKVRSLRAISCGYVKSVRKNNNLRRSGWEDMPTQIMQRIWRNNPCKCIKYIEIKQTLYLSDDVSIVWYFIPSSFSENNDCPKNFIAWFKTFDTFKSLNVNTLNELINVDFPKIMFSRNQDLKKKLEN